MSIESDFQNLSDRLGRLEKTVEQLANRIENIDRAVGDSRAAGRADIAASGKRADDKGVTWISKPVEKPATSQGGDQYLQKSLGPAQEPEPEAVIAPDKSPTKTVTPAKAGFKLPERMRSGEYWLIRVGIGLMLFGVVFLFKYSIDQGWITPWLRTGFGFAIGVVLLSLGLRLYRKRPVFSMVLLGGGIGVWYITGFAAYQLLELVSHSTAFLFMVGVTATSFALSLRRNNALLSIIGALGGFGTPFMLYTSSGNLPGLVMYTCLIAAGAVAIFFFKGWRSLLWLTVVSVWAIFMIGILSSLSIFTTSPARDSWILQGGIAFAWICFWAVPILRDLLRMKNPTRWAYSPIWSEAADFSKQVRDILDRHLHVLTVSSPLTGLALSIIVWPDLARNTWGWIAMGLSAVYFSAAFYLRRQKSFRALTYTHVLVAIFLFTLGLAIRLDGNTLLFALSAEAAVLHLIARRISDRVVSVTAHVLHGLTAYWMIYRLGAVYDQSNAFFEANNLTNVWVVFTYLVAVFAQQRAEGRRIYGLIAAAALAGIFLNTLEGNTELFLLAGEAMLVYSIGLISGDRYIMSGSHALFLVTGGLLVPRLLDNRPEGLAVFNLRAITDLWAIGLAAIVTALSVSDTIRRIYILGIVAALGGLIVREFDSNVQLILLALEGGAVFWLARISRDKAIYVFGHILFFILAVTLGNRLTSAAIEAGGIALLNWTALASILTIGILGAAAWLLDDSMEQTTYRIVAHLGVLAWLGVELVHLSNGHGWVSVSWGIYGAIMLILGLRLNIHRLRILAIGTLMLLVAKLFIVDLAELETIWRVLLFIGFGGVFLLLGYYFRSLWKKEPSSENNAGDE